MISWSCDYSSTQSCVKFCRFCKKKNSFILALFVVFRDTTCTHEIDQDAFFDAFWFLYCLEINDITFEFCAIWTLNVDVRDWIKFIIWFNFVFKCDWIFLIFWSVVFSIRTSMLDDFLFRLYSLRSRYADSAHFAHFAQYLHFASHDLHFRSDFYLNLNSNSWNICIDLNHLKDFELKLFDSRSLNFMRNFHILRCFLGHFLHSWLFWKELLFDDFISITDLFFVFELFVLNFWLRYLAKNWSTFQLRNRLIELVCC